MSDLNTITVNSPEKHLSVECFHKLNRARNVSFQMHLQIRQCEINGLPLFMGAGYFQLYQRRHIRRSGRSQSAWPLR